MPVDDCDIGQFAAIAPPDVVDAQELFKSRSFAGQGAHCIATAELLHHRQFQEQVAQYVGIGHRGRAFAVKFDEAEAAAAILVAGVEAVQAGGGDG